jgi:hypothetical protein
MTFDDASDTGWAVIKAYCEERLDNLDADDEDWDARRRELEAVIRFIEETAP